MDDDIIDSDLFSDDLVVECANNSLHAEFFEIQDGGLPTNQCGGSVFLIDEMVEDFPANETGPN